MEDPYPQIVNADANRRFHGLCERMGLDPDGQWVGNYLEYEWKHSRYLFDSYGICQKTILEFGCGIGATAIVLATLGGHVTGVDVNAPRVELARANAERYGCVGIKFLHVADTTQLPFQSEEFDLVSCNSVLEYVPHHIRRAVQAEISRVLKRGGVIIVTGTSNRLWPKETNEGRWLVNYVPRCLDGLVFGGRSPLRGVFPGTVRFGFGRGYVNLDLKDDGQVFLSAKARMGLSTTKLTALKTANRVLRVGRVTVGLCTPSISVALRKKGDDRDPFRVAPS
jgi:SAM-dependent methyltransferase